MSAQQKSIAEFRAILDQVEKDHPDAVITGHVIVYKTDSGSTILKVDDDV